MFQIALDGPSGAGKSTLAKNLAAHLQFVYVDTGALYRSIGLYVRRKDVDPEDSEAVAALLPEIRLELTYEDGAQHVLLCGEDVSGLIRTPEAKARRRYAELIEKGVETTYEEVLAAMIERDRADSTRAAAPLVKAADAIELNNSEMEPEETFAAALKIIKEKLV